VSSPLRRGSGLVWCEGEGVGGEVGAVVSGERKKDEVRGEGMGVLWVCGVLGVLGSGQRGYVQASGCGGTGDVC